MTEYARIDGSTVIERRVIDDMPDHKAHLWVPVVYEGDGPIISTVIEHDRVRVVKSHQPVEIMKADHISRVKERARQIRDAVRTPGKDMVYAEKKDQAHAVIAMGRDAANALENNGAAQFPLLAGTVGIEAPTLFDLAELVWSKYEMWNALSYHIERAEAAGTKAISDASDAAGIRAAYEAITWPTLP